MVRWSPFFPRVGTGARSKVGRRDWVCFIPILITDMVLNVKNALCLCFENLGWLCGASGLDEFRTVFHRHAELVSASIPQQTQGGADRMDPETRSG
jgi:hypothetical protein